MKKVLIISPRFPPINAPDMHRVRHSLPYFGEMGWDAEVWRVDPYYVKRERDALLSETLPDELSICTVGALNPNWTRLFGLGSLALRSFPFYYWHVSHRLAQGDVDLVYFSTTAFPVVILGRYWKERFGVPYVIDVQDPWYTDYYVGKPKEEQPPKFWFSYRLDKYLEPVAMQEVEGIISVSQGYCDTLQARYDNITPEMCTVIPFGAADIDFGVAEYCNVEQPSLNAHDDTINVVYAGVVPSSMKSTVQSICKALADGIRKRPQLYGRVRLYFVGTSYAPAGEGKKRVEPLARQYGLDDVVTELTDRIPYFQSLKLLRQADHLIIPGSDDSDYTASKLYPYILSRRPLLAVFHEESSVVDVLRRTESGTAVTFDGETSSNALANRIFDAWTPILEQLPFIPDTDWAAFEPYTAEAMTRRQVEVFDQVIERFRRSTQ